MSSVFTQTILQSTLIPLYMSFNLHYLHSTLIIFSIEFNQRFKTSQLFFNLWPYFNLNCFSINCFTFSRLKMMLIEKQLMRLKSRYSQRIHVDQTLNLLNFYCNKLQINRFFLNSIYLQWDSGILKYCNVAISFWWKCNKWNAINYFEISNICHTKYISKIISIRNHEIIYHSK